jgi:hypothetical protein
MTMEQQEHRAEKMLEEKIQVEWGNKPTFGPPSDEEVKLTLDHIQKMASSSNSMMIDVRKEVYEWLEKHLEGAVIRNLGDVWQNKVRTIIARTDEDVEAFTKERNFYERYKRSS